MTVATTLESLQEVDLKLLKHASALAKMPQQQKIKTIELARKKVASELKGIVGQRKDAQTEVADLEAALAHYREKTVEVQAQAAEEGLSFREMRSIEDSLTSLAKREEKTTFELGPARERLSRLELAEKNANAMAERLVGELEAQRSSFDSETAQIKAEIMELTSERSRLAGELDEATLAAYEAARVRFRGLGVERLVGNVPSVCRVKLQPSQFHDLMSAGQIAECPYCHRMLICEEALD